MELSEIIGLNIKLLVDQQFKSRSKLAEFLNVSDQSVTNWITGGNTPSVAVMLKLETVFNLPTRTICTQLVTYDRKSEKYIGGDSQINLPTPTLLESGEITQSIKIVELSEKVEHLWRVNLYRAQMIEKLEMDIQDIKEAFEKLAKEVAELKRK